MSEEIMVTEAEEVSVNETEENEYLIKFKKPFSFEGNVYNSIDMSPIEDLTGAQLCEIHKRFTKTQNVSLTPELNPSFACIVANMVTNLPIEFFYALPAKELNKIKRTVSSYFFAED